MTLSNLSPTLEKSSTSVVSFRRGTGADSFTIFNLFESSLADLNHRFGSGLPTSASNSRNLNQMWLQRRSLYEHLARTADQFWLAEKNGIAIGFVCSILRDNVRQLTELFVIPAEQSGGVGRQLLQRAFPEGNEHKSIIATTDMRAQSLYLKAGVYPRFPLYFFCPETRTGGFLQRFCH
jgi:GNAT superfamily N-acetyltransferase